jgi:hypothetical protein
LSQLPFQVRWFLPQNRPGLPPPGPLPVTTSRPVLIIVVVVIVLAGLVALGFPADAVLQIAAGTAALAPAATALLADAKPAAG